MARDVNVLAGIKVRFGDEDVPLVEMIDIWASRVLKLFRERSTTFEARPMAWGVWDLGAANHIRDAIDKALASHHIAEPDLLLVTDELFKSFTRVEEVDWVSLMGEGAGDGWWWKCIPVSGPVRADFQEHSPSD